MLITMGPPQPNCGSVVEADPKEHGPPYGPPASDPARVSASVCAMTSALMDDLRGGAALGCCPGSTWRQWPHRITTVAGSERGAPCALGGRERER